MSEIQVLLDKEANLANRRSLVHKQIEVLRGDQPQFAGATTIAQHKFSVLALGVLTVMVMKQKLGKHKT